MVGLTGLIASGKSSVVRAWERAVSPADLLCIDSDQVARDVVQPGTAVYKGIVRAFGADKVCEEGAAGRPLDRKALGALVFGDGEAQRARRRVLEGLTHPAIGWTILRRALWEGGVCGRMVVLDAALLLRSPLLLALCAPVVLVDVRGAEQLRRLQRRDGCSPSDAKARVQSQPSRQWMAARSSLVVTNEGTRSQLEEEARGALAKVAGMRGYALRWTG